MHARAKPSKSDIIKLETACWDAMKAKNGDRTAELSGTTSLVTGAKGVMSIPKSKMGRMTEEGKWTRESYAFSDIEVATPTPDVAIIVYAVSQNVKMDGKSQSMRAADSSTWIRGSNGFECHAHSETRLDAH